MASSEEQPGDSKPSSSTECILHKTKTIKFFGRPTPIILQNDNGPCPLLAICNVLLLRNQMTLSPDISEVSQEKLLSLVADRLIGANSNFNNKDEGYAENQQQNIADVLDLLPRLATGIDVNIKFRRIDDFEYTPECAIFDLLDIPLYHGWLVDPQDHETAEAIGSKSYNTLMGDLVSLETRKMETISKYKLDEDSVDFATATTATLGVPSPSVSKANSFDDSPRSKSKLRKGDIEEEAELMRALKLSKIELVVKGDESCQATVSSGDVMMTSHGNLHTENCAPESPVHILEMHDCFESVDVVASVSGNGDVPSGESCFEKQTTAVVANGGNGQVSRSPVLQPEGSLLSNQLTFADAQVHDESITPLPPATDTSHDQGVECLPALPVDGSHKENGEGNSNLTTSHTNFESASSRTPILEAIESMPSTVDSSEPIYEGEECILDSRKTICENREPVYEGEVVLAERADTGIIDVNVASQKDEITLRQGELIDNFLKTNASQLTIYGLFCLQEGLKERAPCVFFRNNHFSTMFKFEDQLYLLATDQGYMNQPDLVWEKLNEVNGDTLFMTSNFKEFRLESSSNRTWDQQNALASTADFLASIDHSSQDGLNMNSDLQFAIALQQQEFEQRPQNSAQQQLSAGGNTRLITGPQVPRSRPTSSSQRQEQKPKDKSNCKIM